MCGGSGAQLSGTRSEGAMRRTVEESFLKLDKRYPDRSMLSIRKRMCIAYLEWKVRRYKPFKMVWVYLAVEFRKSEGRVGSLKRTKLEKLARKHFALMRHQLGCAPSHEAAREFAQGQYERGEGIHSPEQRALHSEMMKKHWKKWIAEGREPRAVDWVITKKDGTEFRIRNMQRWCRENGVHARNLHSTAVKPDKWCTGYRCRKFDPLLDADIPWESELE